MKIKVGDKDSAELRKLRLEQKAIEKRQREILNKANAAAKSRAECCRAFSSWVNGSPESDERLMALINAAKRHLHLRARQAKEVTSEAV